MERREPVVVGPSHIDFPAIRIVRGYELPDGAELAKPKPPCVNRTWEKELKVLVPIARIEPVADEVGNVLD